MFVPFENLPESSRIWIYQADKALNQSEKAAIADSVHNFVENWQVHGQPVKGSYKIDSDRFLIMAADQSFNPPSGCSIDSSVQAVRTIGEKLGINFFDRNLVAFKASDSVLICKVNELKEKLAAGMWSQHSLVFNTTVNTIGDLKTRWIVQAADTWLKRYLHRETVS